jgi:hypothetical protein
MLSPIPSQQGQTGVLVTFTASASDPDDAAQLRFSLSEAPVGAAIDAATGLFNWKPAPSQAGQHTFTLAVSDGTLVAQQALTITIGDPAAYRINAGGLQLTAASGIFAADKQFSPALGFTYASTNPIAGTDSEGLYQTERSSDIDQGRFGYNLPVSNGQYTVVLHFAELYWSAAGQRVFDVSLEGALALDDYDIIRKTGARDVATTETLLVTVTDGTLNINFSALAEEGGMNRPKVSAIEVIPNQSNVQARIAFSGSVLKEATDQTIAASAYPNPFSEEINLKLENAPAGAYTVRLLDLLGKQLYQARMTAGPGQEAVHTLHLADQALIAEGLYLVEVSQQGGAFRKVIKVLKK